MSVDQETQGYGLRWADEDDSGELNPTWTATPDILAIQGLAAESLSLQNSAVTAAFHAEGAFNKLYTITAPDLPHRYLMRVSLPVEPFFKTESEVATMAFLRKHTAVPVANVIAYCSTAANPLHFEWILLEYIEGTPLLDLWDDMSFEAKSELNVRMQGYIQQMRAFNFSRLGNLYFSNVQDRVNGHPAQWQRTSTSEVETDSKFTIGRIVSPWFFRDKRVHLQANRGPFRSSTDLMLSKTNMQIERIKHLSADPSDEYYCEVDEDLAEHEMDVSKTCYALRDLVPVIFPISTDPDEDEQMFLYHHDLSEWNIIVDPETLEVRGIIDWESVGIYPAWQATQFPFFLRGPEVCEPPALGTPGVDESCLTEYRKDWERVRLRRLYRDGLPETSETGAIARKMVFDERLEEIELRWEAARHWTPILADAAKWETYPPKVPWLR
ncbi:phosphotransferase enzyme family-domain-containing protein [Aspergillus oleicola]